MANHNNKHNNHYQNNGQNNQKVKNTETSLMFNKDVFEECLNGVIVPMAMTGIVIKETTNSLADRIVNLYVQAYDIQELEHCLFYPVFDKTGVLVDFDAIMYFNTNIGGAIKNIYRIGNGGNNRTSDGRVDLLRVAGSRTSNGAFNINDKFRDTFAPVANLDNNNNIVIKAVPDSPHIAVVECSFFRLLAVCLGIGSTDPYDFTVAECYPLNNNTGSPDFGLIIIKEMINNNNRRVKSGTNYAALDNKRINSHRYR